MSSTIIRPATRADMTAIGKLGALLVQTHHDFDPQRFLPRTSGTEYGYASFLESQLQEPTVIILVAEQAGKVIGDAYMGIEGHDYMALRGAAGVLYDLIVDPNHRGNGVGELLLNAALEALQAKGIPQVVLQTAENNSGAQRLFARAGFRRTMIEMTRDMEAPDG